MPTPFQAMPQKPPAVSKTWLVLHRPIHRTSLAFRSARKVVSPGDVFNRFLRLPDAQRFCGVAPRALWKRIFPPLRVWVGNTVLPSQRDEADMDDIKAKRQNRISSS